MTVDEEFNGVEKEKKKKNVVVGVRIDSLSREVLSWALVKVAEPGDCVIAVHVCRSSGNIMPFWKYYFCFQNFWLLILNFVFLQMITH